jgi:hypothetical protein
MIKLLKNRVPSGLNGALEMDRLHADQRQRTSPRQ